MIFSKCIDGVNSIVLSHQSPAVTASPTGEAFFVMVVRNLPFLGKTFFMVVRNHPL